MKQAIFHPKARVVLKSFPANVRKSMGKAILEIQKGANLLMPLSKPMPGVALGVEELRIKDVLGIFRAFYYKKSQHGILVFHAFAKKSQKTPRHEIEMGRKRLKEMLDGKI